MGKASDRCQQLAAEPQRCTALLAAHDKSVKESAASQANTEGFTRNMTLVAILAIPLLVFFLVNRRRKLNRKKDPVALPKPPRPKSPKVNLGSYD
jgi:hypothetical protein